MRSTRAGRSSSSGSRPSEPGALPQAGTLGVVARGSLPLFLGSELSGCGLMEVGAGRRRRAAGLPARPELPARISLAAAPVGGLDPLIRPVLGRLHCGMCTSSAWDDGLAASSGRGSAGFHCGQREAHSMPRPPESKAELYGA
jgi:hypothetical protein